MYAFSSGSHMEIEIPSSNVLIYYTEDGTKIAARPSGTEPKIKFYFSTKGTLKNATDYTAEVKKLDKKMDRIIKELKLN